MTYSKQEEENSELKPVIFRLKMTLCHTLLDWRGWSIHTVNSQITNQYSFRDAHFYFVPFFLSFYSLSTLYSFPLVFLSFFLSFFLFVFLFIRLLLSQYLFLILFTFSLSLFFLSFFCLPSFLYNYKSG